MSPALAPVKPRIISPLTSERILLEDALFEWIARNRSHVFLLVGESGAGKTKALEHIAAVCPSNCPLNISDGTYPVAAEPAQDESFLVYSLLPGEVPVSSDALLCWLAPWGQDELIEYLLNVHPRECASVMARLRRDPDLQGLKGSPELLCIVLDRFAQDEKLSSVREALLAELDSRTRDEFQRQRIDDFAVEIWTEKAITRRDIDLLLTTGWCDDPLHRILHHRALQRALLGRAALQMMQTIRETGRPKILEWSSSPDEDLLDELGRVLDQPTRDKLMSIIEDEKSRELHAGAASILISADRTWRPVLQRTWHTPCPGFPTLSGARLIGAQWREIDLSRRVLHRVNLSDADLRGCNLKRAALRSANLQDALIESATLDRLQAEECDFKRARMMRVQGERAVFADANLEEADLTNGSFESANFSEANLKNACFSGAHLANANFYRAQIEGADFSGANFQGAWLQNLPLHQANFSGARFPFANLAGANLEFMRLPGANFFRADLHSSWLTGSVMPRGDFRNANLRNAALADIEWPAADLRDADLRECTFQMGSSRSGLVFTPIASEGTRTGFYTDEFNEQHFKAPEEIRKANLCGADLRGAKIENSDFYLVDLRGAKYTGDQARYLERCGAILHDAT